MIIHTCTTLAHNYHPNFYIPTIASLAAMGQKHTKAPPGAKVHRGRDTRWVEGMVGWEAETTFVPPADGWVGGKIYSNAFSPLP